jgi:SRSO17 transposase
VYLVYATDAGHAVVDRELYLPRSWTDDPDRMRAAGVASQVGFATKPKLATTMIRRALDAGVPASWVAGDEVYGADPRPRSELQARQIGYVLAVACHHRVRFGGITCRVEELLRRVPARRGSVCRPERAPRATACTTGRLRAWTTMVPTSRPGRTPLADGPP